jgi:hypothetical protein
MPKTINLTARTGADIQGDDASDTATLTFISLATEGATLKLGRGTVVGSTSVGLLQIDLASAASGPVFELSNQAFVSCTTIQFTTGATSGVGALYVKISPTTYGWIPILPAGSVTAAAR